MTQDAHCQFGVLHAGHPQLEAAVVGETPLLFRAQAVELGLVEPQAGQFMLLAAKFCPNL